jgi:hypothetical protein
MRRAKKRKNLSSARRYDQIRFRFHTTKTRSCHSPINVAVMHKSVSSEWCNLRPTGLGGSGMRRREFITLLGGASAWPLAVSAQQGAKRPTIGFLGGASPAGWATWTAAFVQRLRELGWIEGRTLAIEYRWAEGRKERFAEIAAEFVQLHVGLVQSLARPGAM